MLDENKTFISKLYGTFILVDFVVSWMVTITVNYYYYTFGRNAVISLSFLQLT